MKKMNETIDKNSVITELEVERSLRQAILRPDIQAFIKGCGLTQNDIRANSVMFLTYALKKKHCDQCQSLHECQQTVAGKAPILEWIDGRVELDYEACHFQKVYDKAISTTNNLQIHGANPEDFQNSKVFTNESRIEILANIKRFLTKYPKEATKGIYLSGPYGCGKSFLMADLAQKLAERGHEILFIYYPNLTRQIKSAIGTPKFEEMIERLKTVEILMLDDFGGEMPSSFIRDEILTPVLQERMVFHRPLFMTSNLGLDQVLEHLSEESKSIDQNRAHRVIARMQTLMEFVELEDKNYRS